ncbi:MAG: LytTR family transcriptional regulator [Candidatus Symbiothrix sp.]|jgi:DNA-binding LytR/AlgR family response regulator|nr:LytTR family transcriptional regulator [Candidatus Symbiothrix sp.]
MQRYGKFLFLTAFCIFSVAAKSQPAVFLNDNGLTYDSLYAVTMDKTVSPDQKFALIKEVQSELILADSAQFYRLYLPFLQEAKQMQKKDCAVLLMCDIAQRKQLENDMDACFAYLDSASVYIDKVKDLRSLAKFHYKMGYYGYLFQKHSKTYTFELLKKAAEYYEKLNMPYPLFNTYSLFVYDAYQSKNTKMMKKALDKMAPIAQTLPENHYLYLQYLGSYYELRNENHNDAIYLDTIVQIRQQEIGLLEALIRQHSILLGRPNVIISYANFVNSVLEQNKNIDFELLEKYISKADSINIFNDLFLQALTQYNKAMIQFRKGNLSAAKMLCLKGLTMLAENTVRLYEDEIANHKLAFYKLLSETEKALNCPQAALNYIHQANEIEKAQRAKFAENQLAEIERETQLLTQEQELQKAKQWQQAEHIVAALLLVVIAAVVVRLITRHRKKLRKIEEQLIATNQPTVAEQKIEFDNGLQHFLLPSEICAIETAGYDRLNIYLTDKIIKMAHGKITEIGAVLPDCFVQIHRSCLINSNYKTHLNRKARSLKIAGKYEFCVSRRCLENL